MQNPAHRASDRARGEAAPGQGGGSGSGPPGVRDVADVPRVPGVPDAPDAPSLAGVPGSGGLAGLLAGVLGAVAGAALQLQLPALWPAQVLLPALGAALAVALGLLLAGAWAAARAGGDGRGAGRPGTAGRALPVRQARRARIARLCAWLVAGLALGFGSTHWRAQERLALALDPALEDQDLLLTGVVADLPRPGPQGTRFVFAVEQALLRGQPVAVPPRLSLGWWRGWDADALLQGPPPDLAAGQRWRFTARLRQPHGAQNPHGFDLELWLFERGLRATGSVRARAGAAPELLEQGVGEPVARLRQHLRQSIERHVADPGTAGVLAALVVGDQGAIGRDDWELFRTTGVAHLMSISGLHVTMFAWLAGGAAALAWRRSPALLLACPAPVAARWIGLAAAGAYAVLAGWGVPAQRTVAMLAALVLLRSLGLRWPLHAVLAAAGAVVVAADPWALLQPGFWLSFAAVALLVASEPVQRPAAAPQPAAGGMAAVLRGAGGAARSALRTQAVATAGLAPLTLLFFQQLSVVGFVANLVAIPLVTLAVVPLALLGAVPPLGAGLWPLAAALLQSLVALLQALAAWPAALWWAAAAPAWAVAAGLLGGALLVLPLPWRLRALGLPLLLPLLAPPPSPPPHGRFELVAADVGQGNAVLLRTRHHLLLYDTGPRWSPQADAGSRVLLPLLRARGERRIDLLMLSHRDSDHTGGAAALLGALPVAALASSLEPGHELLAGAAPGWHRPCAAGQRWQWDGVEFELLHPEPGALEAAHAAAAAPRPNTLSCVLRVAEPGPQGRSLLLAGDIEAAQEAALVRRLGPALASDALLVPHHGSRTSSSATFLDAVAPRVALVQAAYRSRFGHPAPDVLERYAARGIAVVRSDRCGAWTWPAAGAPRCQRQVRQRYWHHPAGVGAVSGPQAAAQAP